MTEKAIVKNILLENHIDWDVKDFGDYVNPNCKSVKSLCDKLCRLYGKLPSQPDHFSITSGKVDDLLRMTVVTEYQDVVPIIKKLKQQFPDLSGYLQIEAAGYHGVHLNLKFGGVPCEIQLAPRVVVMAVDFLHTLYEKWRNRKPCNSQEVMEEKSDFALRNRIYGKIFEIAGFAQYQDTFQKMFHHLNQTKQVSAPLADPNLQCLLDTNLLTNGKLDSAKLQRIAEQVVKSLAKPQEDFVNSVQQCLSRDKVAGINMEHNL